MLALAQHALGRGAKKLRFPEEERLGGEQRGPKHGALQTVRGRLPGVVHPHYSHLDVTTSIKIIRTRFCHMTNATENTSFYKYISNKRTYLSLIEGYTTNTN